MGKSTPVAASRWRLRVHAEGAQRIKAASGLMTFDAKPDPYVTFVFGGVTKHCDHVQDVEPHQYFTWPNAVVEFDVKEESELLQAALVVHVKDKDTLKDRYIGGTSIPLAPLYATKSKDVLCQSKFFVLDYSDEKLKSKKDSGEVKLTITVVDTMAKAEPTPPAVAVKEEERKAPVKEETAVEIVTAPEQKPPTEDEKKVEKGTVVGDAPIVVVSAPVVQLQPEVAEKTAVETRETAPLPAQEPPKEERRASVRVEESAPQASKRDPVSRPDVRVKALKIELVSARELTRPTSLGALFDRKPDPMVTLEFYGQTKTSVALKDVDLKKPVEWSNTFLDFELPKAPPPAKPRKGCGPMDLVVHVKDENLMKATYMGGGKLDLAELFQARDSEALWVWVLSTAVGSEDFVERVVTLMYADEKLSKRKASGEITLRFHFIVEEDEPRPASVQPQDVVADTKVKEEPSVEVVAAKQQVPAASSPPQLEVPTVKKTLSGDIKMLSIELLCGRDLVKPSAGNLAKSVMKSLFDRKPDPYAVLVLGSQTKRCPGVNDVDVSFFEWKKAVQVFEFTSKPYPETLLIHIRDEDVAGSDPYMGGARVAMDDIWNEAVARSRSDPPGDPQLVKTFQLTFLDEKMTKQKACGSITVRFRWIYAEAELPVVELPVVPDTTVSADPEAPKLDPIPILRPHMGFIYLRKMVLHNNVELLDASLDLYIELSPFTVAPDAPTRSEHHHGPAPGSISSVLTDAMKGKEDSPNAKVTWDGDELVMPVCGPLENDPSSWDLRIDLKDKNAIMKDAEIAFKCLCLNDLALDFASGQLASRTLELEASASIRKKTKTTSTIKFEAELQFLSHDSPLLSAAASPEKHGGIVTLFLLRSVCSPSSSATTKDPPLDGAVFSIDIDCIATKKSKGLLSFGKSSAPEFQSSSAATRGGYKDGKSAIAWWTAANFPLSSKQFATVKEKEAFDVELAVKMRTGKQDKVVGSLQTNIFNLAFAANATTRIETIQFGTLGSMQLEFAAAFRIVTEETHSKAHVKTAKPVAPLVPSGDLHLLVLCARNLVSPDPKDEKSEDLDPEVRVSVEPKYIKRKENPIRSMLKTKPLENAGSTPTWNEYLRLEYRLPPPPPPPPQPSQSAVKIATIVEEPVKYPPPIVQLGVFDIQMPGEKNGSQVIGKVELPLSAFLLIVAALTDTTAPPTALEPVVMTLDVHLADKKTGILSIEGIFEPLPPESKPVPDDPAEIYRQQCRVIGRQLRDKSKKLKSGELTSTAATGTLLAGGATKRAGSAGRLELHVIGFRGSKDLLSSQDQGLSAHVWLSSKVDDRRELKSKQRSHEQDDGKSECQIEWDSRLTLYTREISAELLRTEVLTFTGKPIGSLKLPLGGLIQSSRAGHTVREWHTLIDSMSVSTSRKGGVSKDAVAHEILLELAFFPDQVIFDPIAIVPANATMQLPCVVVINCRKLIYFDGTDQTGANETACKFTLLGNTPNKFQSAAERTSFKGCDTVDASAGAITAWNEKVKLEVGGSALAFLTESFAIGSLPAVRLELINRRQGGRFPDVVATTNVSLATLLQFAGTKVYRWLKLYVGGEDTSKKGATLVAMLELELTVLPNSNAAALKDEKLLAQALEDSQPLAPIAGVLCLRFLSARNLTDVDANGEQDPYIISKVIPRSFSTTGLPSACQTGVSLNGGRHPTWNSGIFELRCEDLLTDYVRFEVMDSNEEDHLPDAYIGAIEIALSSLFRDSLSTGARSLQQKRTRWLEAWVPIYPVNLSAAVDSGETEENAGEVRVEFRFLTQGYYESSSRQESDALITSSPFTTTAESIGVQAVRGTLLLHIVQASGVPCTKGMQPGVRINASHTVSHVTKPGKQSITSPRWENEVAEFAWPPDTASIGTENTKSLLVEVVDLAVRTANANALAVVAFGHIDISPFLTHHLAKSYHLYPLHGRKTNTSSEPSASILIGCQFVPEGREKEVDAGLQQQTKRDAVARPSGSLHVKSVQAKFDLPAFFNCVPLGSTLSLGFKCAASSTIRFEAETKKVAFPSFSLTDLVNSDGRVVLGTEDTAVLFKYTADEPTEASTITPNPTVVGELVAHTSASQSAVVAEFEVPIFDYVLFDGHLGSAWYALTLSEDKAAMQANEILGEILLEVQFLPVLAPPVDAAPSKRSEDSGLVLLGVEIKNAVGFAHSSKPCVVVAQLLGCRAESNPGLPTATSDELKWSEVLDLPMTVDSLKNQQTAAILRLELRAAHDTSVVFGSCNWVVPKELIAMDAGLSSDSGSVVVPLDPPASANMDKNTKSKAACQLTFRLFRQDTSNALVPAADSNSSSTTRRRRGVLYVLLTGGSEPPPKQTFQGVLLKAVDIKNSTVLETLLESRDSTWMELSQTERRVIPVDESNDQLDSRCVVICGADSAKSASQVAVLDAHALVSIVKTPGLETFHRLPVLLPSNSNVKTAHIPCKIMYLETLQGELELHFESISWPTKQSNNGRLEPTSSGMFRVEVRLLGSSTSQKWASSPVGVWNRKSSEIRWPASKNRLVLGYTNAEETTEPAVQLVLVQVMDGESVKKEAFGQITVLSAITASHSDFVSASVPLTTIGGGSSESGIELRYQLRFVREEFSFEEVEAKLAAEREATALALAEGTSKLKKAFAAMGGDEQTSIQIAELKKYVVSKGDTDAYSVLQHAADVETDGDLDRLFEMMDVNGDGAISWNEYVTHIQNIHALADASATQKQEKANAVSRSEVEASDEEPEDPEEEEPVVVAPSKAEEREDGEEGDSDLDDITRAPTRPMRIDSAAEEVVDDYKPAVPTGQATKEAVERRQSQTTEARRSTQELAPKEVRREPREKAPLRSEARRQSQLERTEDDEPPKKQAVNKKLPELSTYVLDWKVDEVIQWMTHEMELGQYADAVQQNAVNGKLLLTLREEELESELGVTAVLHKRKLMNQIHEFQERFQYPPQPEALEKKQPRTMKKPLATTMATASMMSETPAFIKREQLVYQEKQRVKQAEAEASHQPRMLGQSRVFPSKTVLVNSQASIEKTDGSTAATKPQVENNPTIGETFNDAMLDIFEAVHPDSPEKRVSTVSLPQTTALDVDASFGYETTSMPQLPLIQIGSITNTDELFEIVRQRIHQLSQLLLPMAHEQDETWSDFGDDPDDDEEAPPPSEEMTALRLVFDAFRHSRRSASTDKVSRLKFQEGIVSLLAIDVSWHQFDLLFRKLDVDGDSELCWDEFHHVFTKRHISFERNDLLLLQDALVSFVLDRLESQQWTLSDLFKAFDRDGGGTVSIAEFATLVRFLFTSSTMVRRHQAATKHKIHKRHVYLLMSCLDVSADRRISLQEFLRFFFIVWSSKLMEVQDQLLACEAAFPLTQTLEDQIASLKNTKKRLRRALRTNFSRPFRDAMRCLDVTVPGPFTGLLARLQLQPTASSDHQEPDEPVQAASGLQVWQVLRGQTNATSGSHSAKGSFTHLHASTKAQTLEASRKRVQKGKNEVLRTRLTRQREPSRQDAELRTPGTHVSLDQAAKLKFDYRPL